MQSSSGVPHPHHHEVVIKKVPVNIVSTSWCRSLHGNSPQITVDTICAGSLNRGCDVSILLLCYTLGSNSSFYELRGNLCSTSKIKWLDIFICYIEILKSFIYEIFWLVVWPGRASLHQRSAVWTD